MSETALETHQKPRKIAVLLDCYGHYQETLLGEIQNVFLTEGISVVTFLGRELNPEVQFSAANHIYELAQQGDYLGCIIAGASLSHNVTQEELATFSSTFKTFPVISLGIKIPKTHSVIINQRTGMLELTEHLIKLGHKRFAFMHGYKNNADSQARERALRATLYRHSLPLDNELILEGNFSTPDAFSAMDKFLAKRQDFDVVVAANDAMAYGVMQALATHNLLVPHDVAVVGYDNQIESSYVTPPLTTVDQPNEKLAREAALQLLRRIKGETIENLIEIPSTLVLRRSCGYEPPSSSINSVYSRGFNLTTAILRDMPSEPHQTRLIHQLVDSFSQSLSDQSERYLSAWHLQLQESKASSESIIWWLDLLKSMESHALTGLGRNKLIKRATKQLMALQKLILEWSHKSQFEDQFTKMQLTILQGREHAAFTLISSRKELWQKLSQMLSTQRIGYCFLALYESNSSQTQAQLHYAFDGNKQLDLTKESHKSADLLPERFQSFLDTSHYLVLPLFVGSQTYGYVLIENHNSDFLYEAMAHMLSISIRNSLQLQNLQRHTTQLQSMNNELAQLSNYDALTGLPNRTLFHERLEQAFCEADQNNNKVALLFFDLDGFKYINDSLGHSIGDQLLTLVAKRMQRLIRESDSIARLGGDEFTVILKDLADLSASKRIAEAILESFRQAYRLSERTLHMSASIGISIYPDDGKNVETILKHADTAMYSAKAHGRNRYQFFSQELDVNALERLKLEQSIRLGLGKKEFFVVYQPKVSLENYEIRGFEALVRWRHEGKVISPDVFIPIAENTNFIEELGCFVLIEACTQAKQWQDAGVYKEIAVNLSVKQLQKNDIVEEIQSVLTLTGLDPEWLELEITESAAMHDIESTICKLEALRAIGIKIAIDDFGTAYSSLNYLKRLPVTSLKIDQSFVQDIDDANSSSVNAAIIKAVVALGKSLNFKLVAEGVEETVQANFLQAIACDEAQGYLFDKPLSKEEATERLKLSLTSGIQTRQLAS